MKNILLVLGSIVVLAIPFTVSAHVVVRPNQVGIGAFQTFTMSAPSEKDSATTELRLVLPQGLESVTPTVKPGWNISVKRESNEPGARATEILWRGGRVPAHFRDDFSFSAKAPATPTVLAWKVYQTYENGAMVAWENDPKAEQPKKEDGTPDFSSVGPFSETNIVDDLTAKKGNIFERMREWNLDIVLSGVALLLALGALAGKRRRA